MLFALGMIGGVMDRCIYIRVPLGICYYRHNRHDEKVFVVFCADKKCIPSYEYRDNAFRLRQNLHTENKKQVESHVFIQVTTKTIEKWYIFDVIDVAKCERFSCIVYMYSWNYVEEFE